MNIRGIILAAGKSSRMGENKLQLKINETPIIDLVIYSAKRSILDEIVVVYGRYNLTTDLRKIYNADYEKGMSTSIKCGLKGFTGDAVMILLGDMPFIDAGIIDEIYYGFVSSSKNIAVPLYKGKRGNPVIVGSKYFEELMSNLGDKGARDIIKNHIEDVVWVEVKSDKIFVDVDSKEMYESL